VAGRGRTSYQKKLKEQARFERRQEKAARKQARKEAKHEVAPGPNHESDVDPDNQLGAPDRLSEKAT
jgi:hypothetical protein